MVTVAVTGASGRTGRRLVARLERDPTVTQVLCHDSTQGPGALTAAVGRADAVVHLGPPRTTAEVLAATSDALVSLVHRSSAAVYGAWADNRVPLTEDVGLRPNPGFGFAVEHAEAERLVAEWLDDHPTTSAAVLRPAPVVSPGRESWESSTLGRPSRLRRTDAIPPAQFLHVDDAAAAFHHALSQRLEGTFNVAPDGFVPGETVRSLAGSGVTLPLPERAAAVAESIAWRLGWGAAPAAAAPYRIWPWVVASDRFRATGWSPVFTNEEALVTARKGSWWRELSPKRRQELTLGASAGGLVAAGAGLAALVRARARR